MASVTGMLQTIQNFFTLQNTYDVSNSATSATLSGSELQQACDAYQSNPSFETARDVLTADKNFFEKLNDFIGGLPLPGFLPTDLATEAAKSEASNVDDVMRLGEVQAMSSRVISTCGASAHLRQRFIAVGEKP